MYWERRHGAQLRISFEARGYRYYRDSPSGRCVKTLPVAKASDAADRLGVPGGGPPFREDLIFAERVAAARPVLLP